MNTTKLISALENIIESALKMAGWLTPNICIHPVTLELQLMGIDNNYHPVANLRGVQAGVWEDTQEDFWYYLIELFHVYLKRQGDRSRYSNITTVEQMAALIIAATGAT